MKFNLSIRYQTHWGESVFLCLERKNISNEDCFLEIELEYRNTEEWGKVLDLDDVLSNADTFYFYRIRKNKAILKEDRSHRFFPISDASIGAFHEIVIIDEWNDMMIPHNVYHKSYFSRLQEQSPIVSMVCNPSAATPHQFVVTTHHLAPRKKIGILGSSKELHFWDVKRPLMLEQDGNRWHLEMQFDTTGTIQYKYVICDDASGELIAFEKGNNRIIDLNSHHEKAIIWNQFADFSAYA
ncbi:MAG: hypothetical protein RIR96_631, partial [Bacteroidota bacterium]